MGEQSLFAGTGRPLPAISPPPFGTDRNSIAFADCGTLAQTLSARAPSLIRRSRSTMALPRPARGAERARTFQEPGLALHAWHPCRIMDRCDVTRRGSPKKPDFAGPQRRAAAISSAGTGGTRQLGARISSTRAIPVTIQAETFA